MAEVIKQSDLRNNNAEIMRRVAAGESFTVTVHGQAVADLVPHQRKPEKRQFVPISEINALLAADNVDSDLWSTDMAEADSFFDDEEWQDPWTTETAR
jgi:prevent-host-death family protein